MLAPVDCEVVIYECEACVILLFFEQKSWSDYLPSLVCHSYFFCSCHSYVVVVFWSPSLLLRDGFEPASLSLANKSPITEAYQSAYAFADMTSAAGGGFGTRAVTRSEYLESGSTASRKKFLDWKSADDLEKSVFERINETRRDNDAQSHRDGGMVTDGPGFDASGKERDTYKEIGDSKGRRSQRDEPRQTPRGDDRAPQNHEAPSASTSGRLTRTRSSRTGTTGTSK